MWNPCRPSGRGPHYHLRLDKEARALFAHLTESRQVCKAAGLLLPRALKAMATALSCRVCQLALLPFDDRTLLVAPCCDAKGMLLMRKVSA